MTRKEIRRMFVIAATLMLISSGNAFADPYPVRLPADAPGSGSVVVPDRLPDPHRAFFGGTQVDGTSFAISGARGSAAVGLLFGPIGILANQAVVANTNSERGSQLGILLQTDVNALLRQLTPASPPAASAAFYELVPMVSVKFSDATHFKLECFLFAYTPVGERWGRGNFRAFGVGEFDANQPESMDAAAAALPSCVQEVYSAFIAYVDHRGEFVDEARVRLLPEGGRPVTLHYLRTDDGRHVIFNVLNLVRSFRVEDVEFVEVQH
jgi:hypothetical protein